ncbi:GTPase-activating protein [Geothermobacter hydrogeniphilus]|uniref:GTPase-activating protein n=1 Tax=Geothermobacter hydrogeniphilus TaxID=1969733 RepID=A0A2K2HD63_9BACT|nr:GTPase-activating protein [Geothermobacter hydrogeniphilus]PNU21237.1 GTPase-activating protein [Geothermobacter hydrogeniphilus]
MPFKKMLGTMLERIPGSLGAIIVDWEGESVDQAGRLDAFELKVIGAHKGLILDNLRQAVARAEGNDLEEIIITTAQRQTIIMPANRDYFLVVALERKDVMGRALFEARRCLEQLKEEIA